MVIIVKSDQLAQLQVTKQKTKQKHRELSLEPVLIFLAL
jgi:hypothetical protein